MVTLVVTFTFAQTSQAKDSDKDVIAVVLGKKITVKDKARLDGLVFGTLMEKYARDNKIAATDAEIDAFVKKTEESEKRQQIRFEKDRKKLKAELKSPDLTERERKDKESRLQSIERILKSAREMKQQTQGMEEQLAPMKRQMARNFITRWKINKALYAKYGGRVIFQQAGPEPVDAYRDFLKEQEKNGAFQILDKQYEAPFWRYFTDDALHNFYPNDEGAKFINTPWWTMEPQQK